MRIVPVRSSQDLHRFVMLPWSLYRGDPHWVPPLISEEKRLLDRRINPFHAHASVEYFLAEIDGRDVGRIAAIIDHHHNELHQEKTGFFGFFETIPDPAVARELFEAAEAWLCAHGMNRIRGPFNPSINETCGLLIEGFGRPPMIMMTYNPEYYAGLIEALGYAKAMDLLAYFLPTRDFIRDKFERIAAQAAGRGEVTIRSINLKNFRQELATVQDIYNNAWEKNWGFVPMTEEEIRYSAHNLKSIIPTEYTYIAEVKGKPVGFALALPDINLVLKRLNGRLFPFGWLKILLARRKIPVIRIVALGVMRPYQHLGIGTLFYLEYLNRAVKNKLFGAELSWILETNTLMNKPLQEMGARPYKKYRIYEKSLA